MPAVAGKAGRRLLLSSLPLLLASATPLMEPLARVRTPTTAKYPELPPVETGLAPAAPKAQLPAMAPVEKADGVAWRRMPEVKGPPASKPMMWPSEATLAVMAPTASTEKREIIVPPEVTMDMQPGKPLVALGSRPRLYELAEVMLRPVCTPETRFMSRVPAVILPGPFAPLATKTPPRKTGLPEASKPFITKA